MSVRHPLTSCLSGPVESYIQNFQWNKVKYRADKPISELIDTLQKETAAVDNDVKAKFNQYNAAKTSLAAMQRSTTGNLSQKSLTSIVNPDWLLKPDASEYLQQHLIAVPAQISRDFLKDYETIAPMVVPRSAQLLAKDAEFQLWSVTVFKKHAPEFLHKCREHRWTPREWKFNEGGKEAEDRELQDLEKEERRLWGEALRLGRTGYSDAVMSWMHVLALRVFVETVLRYGLPLSFVCGVVKVSPTPSYLKTPRASMHAEIGPKEEEEDELTAHSSPDRLQTREKGKGKPRRPLLRSRRQRHVQRQKGQTRPRRLVHAAGHGRRRPRRRRAGLRALRLLPLRTPLAPPVASIRAGHVYRAAFVYPLYM